MLDISTDIDKRLVHSTSIELATWIPADERRDEQQQSKPRLLQQMRRVRFSVCQELLIFFLQNLNFSKFSLNCADMLFILYLF